MIGPIRSGRVAVALAVALAVAAYANTLANDFAYDDVAIVLENPEIRSLRNAPDLFTGPYRGDAYGGPRHWLYRPVSLLSLSADWTLWEGRAFGFHLTNVLLHAAATAFLTLLLLRLAGPTGAAIGGALFAVHPVHTEAVANIVGRAEVLAAAAVFAALWLTARPAPERTAGETSPLVALSAGLLYGLGILAKESAIVLPGLLLLVDAVRWRGFGRAELAAYLKARARLFSVLLVVALAALVLRGVAAGSPLAGGSESIFGSDAGARTRFFTMIRVWPHYLRLLIAPFDLAPDYGPAVILPAISLTLLGGLGVAIALATLALAAALWKRERLVSVGILWVPVALLPVSNLIFPSSVLLAERTLYLASAGVSLAAAGVALAVARSTPVRRIAAAGAAVVAILAFTVVTVRRNPAWKDTFTLFSRAVHSHPESYRAQWALGNSLAASDRWPEAMIHYLTATRLWPHDGLLWTELAAQYTRRGLWEPAIQAATRAVTLAPGNPTAHHLRVTSLLGAGRSQDAARAARDGLERVGADELLYFLLAQARERLGQHRLAAHALRASIALGDGAETESEAWIPWYHVGRLYGLAGDRELARAALDSAQARAGSDPRARGAIEALREYRLRGELDGERGEVRDER